MFISFINRLHPSMYTDGLDTKTMQYFTWLQVNLLLGQSTELKVSLIFGNGSASALK